MARLVRAWGTTKPAPGGQVNWGHPLAQGLISAVPFAEGAGHPRDWAQGPVGGNGVVLGGGTLTFPASGWTNTRLGPAILFTKTTTEGIKIGLGGVVQSTDGVTLVGWTTQTNGSSEIEVILNAGPSTTGPEIALFAHHTANNGPRATWYQTGGPGDTPAPARTYPADATTVNQYAFVHRPGGGGAGRIFANGVMLGTGSTGQTGTPTTADFYIGADTANTALAHRGAVIQTLIYRRALSDTEIAWLYTEPYAWAMSPTPRSFTYTGTAFLPRPNPRLCQPVSRATSF